MYQIVATTREYTYIIYKLKKREISYGKSPGYTSEPLNFSCRQFVFSQAT